MADSIADPGASGKRGAEYVRLNRQGLSYSQIAKRYGTSRNAVAGAIFRHLHPGYVPKPSMETANRLRNARALRKKHRIDAVIALCRPSTPRDFTIIRMLSEGHVYHSIAAKLGVSRQRVHQLVDSMRKRAA